MKAVKNLPGSHDSIRARMWARSLIQSTCCLIPLTAIAPFRTLLRLLLYDSSFSYFTILLQYLPSSILVWKIPWTEEPGELQSMGWQRVRHDWVNEHTQETLSSLAVNNPHSSTSPHPPWNPFLFACFMQFILAEIHQKQQGYFWNMLRSLHGVNVGWAD